MYLGANGWYWRIAWHDALPGVMEVRRAEDGIRTWEAEPGEYHHSFTGEFGGLWRRIGRPPNVVTGTGFTAQGFDLSSYYVRQPDSFDPRAAFLGLADRPLRLANFGYLGHMWELYAMWAWIGAFLQASFALSLAPDQASLWAKLVTFATIAAGALGCLAAGFLADRWGRTTLTMLAMAVSGGCALAVGFLFGAAPWLLIPLCLVWGVSIAADSAQVSSSIAELSERHLVGTMLTVQTSLGFLLTLITIHLMPYAVDWLGWRYAFAPLAVGPFLGVWAMARLAGGRR